jgi:uncharacterized protein
LGNALSSDEKEHHGLLTGALNPLLTIKVHEILQATLKDRRPSVECSLDLDRTQTRVELSAASWQWRGHSFPYLEKCKERTIYYWTGKAFEPIARYTTSLIKLVPTEWGAPTFEIDGIKMLPTSRVSPYEDARHKVALIEPKGKIILDTCGGLGYFAAWCLKGQALRVLSYEKNPDVIWLRSLNPWSPENDASLRVPLDLAAEDRTQRLADSTVSADEKSPRLFPQPPASSLQPDPQLTLIQADILEHIASHPDASFDAVLHDPPRFAIAGDLYSQAFYRELWRVLKRRGKLFHYTGTPNKLTSGRDVPAEVAKRLQDAGFAVARSGDGILATKR